MFIPFLWHKLVENRQKNACDFYVLQLLLSAKKKENIKK